jgi:1-acyl-sn-glycerol-3-phosphate acyltransferase
MPITLVCFKDPRNNTRFLKFIVPLARKILGLKVITEGVENIPSNEPSVFVMNHQASLDILVNFDCYPKRCLVIGKREIAFIPVFGWLFYFCGNILLTRSNKKSSRRKMSHAAEVMLGQKVSIWVFSEGTRSYGKGLGPFKKGAFHLASETGAPIVPVVASDYVGKIDFSKWSAGTIVIKVLPPLFGIKPETVQDYCDLTRSQMLEQLQTGKG